METAPGYTANSAVVAPADSPKLLDRVRDRIRRKGYSLRTERSYARWIKRFILFHGKQHPQEMGTEEVEAFLTSLAVDRDVVATTQNLALSAILFLYREVLEMPLPWLDGTGMRLMEGVRLRVKDVDFAARQIPVRDGKGGKDRVTMLPDALARRGEPAGPVVKSMKILGAGGTALNEYSLVCLSPE